MWNQDLQDLVAARTSFEQFVRQHANFFKRMASYHFRQRAPGSALTMDDFLQIAHIALFEAVKETPSIGVSLGKWVFGKVDARLDAANRADQAARIEEARETNRRSMSVFAKREKLIRDAKNDVDRLAELVRTEQVFWVLDVLRASARELGLSPAPGTDRALDTAFLFRSVQAAIEAKYPTEMAKYSCACSVCLFVLPDIPEEPKCRACGTRFDG